MADVTVVENRPEDRRGSTGQATREAAIDCAIELLDAHGEQGLRIAEVTSRSGVSVGSIYHHFGDRDGLIKAARTRQFCASTSTYGVGVLELAVKSSSSPEFVRGLRELHRDTFSRARDHERFQRAVYIASAASRPDLLTELRDHQTQMIEIGTEVAKTLIDRGWVREGVSPRAFATLALALEFGGVVAALDEERITDEQWCDVIQLAIEGVLRLDPGAEGSRSD